MNTLITGSSGFVGTHALKYFVGVPLDNVDLRNKPHLHDVLKNVKLDRVLHLAGQSFVPESINDPQTTFNINFLGTYNLLSALKECGFSGRFIYVSSGDVYGKVASHELPIKETTLPKPRNPYSVSKVAAEALCYQWSQTEAFEIIITRPFNHIGVGQDERFVISSIAKQLAKIKLNLSPPIIQVGDISVSRDFSPVDNILDAYQALFEQGINGEIYNIASGQARSIESLLLKMLDILGIDATINKDETRFRQSEQREVFASNRKLIEHTGWQPQKELDATLERILNDWMEKLT